MKKLLLIAIAGVIALTFMACSRQSQANDPESTTLSNLLYEPQQMDILHIWENTITRPAGASPN